MRQIRVSILMAVFLLIAIGIVMIYSSTSIYAWEKFGDSSYFLKRHLIFLLIGLMLTALVMVVDYRVLKKYSKPLVSLSVFMLLLLLVPGISREVSGAKRWFLILGFGFQPSECASLAVIIYVSAFLSRKTRQSRDYFVTGFLPPIMILGLVSLLILAQPDLGTVIALGVVVFILLLCAGSKVKHVLYIGLSALPFLYLLIFRVPYRRMRIISFLNPWADPLGSGFQLIQSQVALGSGGLFGKGLGKSMQKLFYLPAGHTDFIFSIIGEELGFFASLAVLAIFVFLFIQGIRAVKRIQDAFGAYLSLGIISLITLKALINIGVSTGIFPTKGLPLPFISYGGSALIFDMIGMGILLNAARFGENP